MESFRNACNKKCQYYAFQRNATTPKPLEDSEIASRWDANLLCDICRHFASVMLHFASLISHNLCCIPAYTHQIPMGFSIVITNISQRKGKVYFFAWLMV